MVSKKQKAKIFKASDIKALREIEGRTVWHTELVQQVLDEILPDYKLISGHPKLTRKSYETFYHETCGNEFTTSMDSILKQGTRCPCEVDLKQLTIDDISTYINNVDGYTLVSTEYTGHDDKLQIHHSVCDTIYLASYHTFQQGKRCSTCYKQKLRSGELGGLVHLRFNIDDVRKVYANEDYTLLSNVYTNDKEKLSIKHNICGHEFEARFNDFQNGNRCPKCSNINGASKREKLLHNDIKSMYNGEIIPQHRIGRFEIDAYIPEHNIGIEFNGNFWHSDTYKEKNYHFDKSMFFDEHGIRIIHIYEYQFLTKPNIVKSIISNAVNSNTTRIFARKCTIGIVSHIDTMQFLNTNHIQGSTISTINIGLYYNNELVSIMTFGRPRFNRDYDWELLRYCTKLYTTVVGGASKLFTYFKRNYQFSSILSYASIDRSHGNIYEILGFEFIKYSEPSYGYIKGDRYISRFQAQKKKLANSTNICKVYNEDLTEYENMELNNWKRLYNAGNLVYVFNNEKGNTNDK